MTSSELKAAMAQARTYVPIGSTWRHRKGEEYFVVGHCVLAGYMVPAVLCRGTDSVVWCRPATQFHDGRLTRLDMPAAQSGDSVLFQPSGDKDGLDSQAGE